MDRDTGETAARFGGGGDSAVGATDALGYRRALPGFSTNPADASANDGREGGFFARPRLLGGMDKLLPAGATRRLPDLKVALKTIALFWLFYFALTTVRGLVIGFPGQAEIFERRTIATLVGAGITFLVYLAMQPLGQASLPRKATFGALLCFPAALAFAAFNYFLFYVYSPMTATWIQDRPGAHNILSKPLVAITDSTISWYFFFAAWTALYVAMSYAQQLRASDRRAALLAREAQDAQLRALRYQINPHFLFNTLNSLSSLILSQRTDVAERMIMNLSTFFRTTLSADPTADVPLDEEIKLQRLYLDIEKIRFPDRLNVEIDVPEPLLKLSVPVLILQPAVENAVKYGVAKSRRPVAVRISAWEEAGRLHVKVKDDGEYAPEPLSDDQGGSTGVGLANVADRLYARYGHQAGVIHGPDTDGGFTVHLFLPLNRNGG